MEQILLDKFPDRSRYIHGSLCGRQDTYLSLCVHILHTRHRILCIVVDIGNIAPYEGSFPRSMDCKVLRTLHTLVYQEHRHSFLHSHIPSVHLHQYTNQHFLYMNLDHNYPNQRYTNCKEYLDILHNYQIRYRFHSLLDKIYTLLCRHSSPLFHRNYSPLDMYQQDKSHTRRLVLGSHQNRPPREQLAIEDMYIFDRLDPGIQVLSPVQFLNLR